MVSPTSGQLAFWAPRVEEEEPRGDTTLEASTWSRSVALDPKHRPQELSRPSATVRREWCRSPQEAHLLDRTRGRYRRLSVEEIAVIQGFEESWFDVPGLSRWQRIQAAGDAVPPPLAMAVVQGACENWRWENETAVEICAGAGGLAQGALSLGLEHLLLVDSWEPAVQILSDRKPWPSDRVRHARVEEIDAGYLRGKVGLLSGGPPCQPWSLGGARQGADDPRDLLMRMHELVAAVEPEIFIFENVPGLISPANEEYLNEIMRRLQRPSDTASYGIRAGVLNAADYGVPQVRRRVFILGFRDRPNAYAYAAFDRIHDRGTHRDPSKAHPTRKRWETLGEALSGLPDPGGWKQWVPESTL